MSMSEEHAAVININGEAYSWGSGKYGELGLDKIIYSPFPSKISSKKSFSKVFCSELITCFLDTNSKFSFFGVIIKILKGNYSSITLKNLLKDENNSDPFYLFQERTIYELASENFQNVVIGNGFVGLLSDKGLVYSLDHSDNITVLYSKYFVYSFGVSNNQIYGLCKDDNLLNFPKENLNKEMFLSSYSNNNLLAVSHNTVNSYLCRWIASYVEKDHISDIWTTNLYKITDSNFLSGNMNILDSKNKEVLLLMLSDNSEDEIPKLSSSTFNMPSPLNKDNDVFPKFNEYGEMSMSKRISAKNSKEILSFVCSFDDSYNMKYKRFKNFQGAKPVLPNTSQNFNKNPVDENFVVNKIFSRDSMVISNFSYNDIMVNENNMSKEKIIMDSIEEHKYDNHLETEIGNNELLTFKSNGDLNSDLLKIHVNNNKEIDDTLIDYNSDHKNIIDEAKFKFVIKNKSTTNFFNQSCNLEINKLNLNSLQNFHNPDSNFSNDEKVEKTPKADIIKNSKDTSDHLKTISLINILDDANVNLASGNNKRFDYFSKKIFDACQQSNRYKYDSDIEVDFKPDRIDDPTGINIRDGVKNPIHEDFNILMNDRTESMNVVYSNLNTDDHYQNTNSGNSDLFVNLNNLEMNRLFSFGNEACLRSTLTNFKNDIVTNQSSNTNISCNSNSYRRKKLQDSSRKINIKPNSNLSPSHSSNVANDLNEDNDVVIEKKAMNVFDIKKLEINPSISNETTKQEISTNHNIPMKSEELQMLKKEQIDIEYENNLGNKDFNDLQLSKNEELDKLMHVNNHKINMHSPEISNNNLNTHVTSITNDTFPKIENNLVINNNDITNSDKNEILKIKTDDQPLFYGIREEDTLIYSTSFNSNSSNNYLKILLLLNNKCSLFTKILTRKFHSVYLRFFRNYFNETKQTESEKDSIEVGLKEDDKKSEGKAVSNHVLDSDASKTSKIESSFDYSDLNTEILFVSKIVYKVMTVHFRNLKSRLYNRMVFDTLRESADRNRRGFLLKKLIQLNFRINIGYYFKLWLKNLSISKAVSNLDKLYHINLNYFFSIFKHQIRIYAIKIKYFREFISCMERISVKNLKEKHFRLIIKRMFYEANYELILRNLEKIEIIMETKSIHEFLRKLKKITVLKKLMKKNLEYLIGILDNKIYPIKMNLFTYLNSNLIRTNLIRKIFLRKNQQRLLLLNKILTSFKHFALNLDESLFINIKLKKVWKIYHYKLKMVLIKMLYRWNNIATKRWKPKMKKTLLSKIPKYQINDFRNKFKITRLSGNNSYYHTCGIYKKIFKNFLILEKNEKFLKMFTTYVNLRLGVVKLKFFQGLIYKLKAEKILQLIKTIEKQFMKKYLYSIVLNLQIKGTNKDEQSCLEPPINESCENNESFKVNGMAIYNRRDNNINHNDSRRKISFSKTIISDSQTPKTLIYKINDNSIQSQFDNFADINVNILNTSYYNTEHMVSDKILQNNFEDSEDYKDMRSNLENTTEKMDLSLKNNDNLEYTENNNIDVGKIKNHNSRIHKNNLTTPKFENDACSQISPKYHQNSIKVVKTQNSLKSVLLTQSNKSSSKPLNNDNHLHLHRHHHNPSSDFRVSTLGGLINTSTDVGPSLKTLKRMKRNSNFQINNSLINKDFKDTNGRSKSPLIALNSPKKIIRIGSTKNIKPKNIFFTNGNQSLRLEPKFTIESQYKNLKYIVDKHKTANVNIPKISNRRNNSIREFPTFKNSYRTVYDNLSSDRYQKIFSDRGYINKSTLVTYETKSENRELEFLLSWRSEKTTHGQNSLLTNNDKGREISTIYNGKTIDSNLCLRAEKILYRNKDRLMIFCNLIENIFFTNKKDTSSILIKRMKFLLKFEKNKRKIYGIKILNKTFLRREYFYRLKLFYSCKIIFM